MKLFTPIVLLLCAVPICAQTPDAVEPNTPAAPLARVRPVDISLQIKQDLEEFANEFRLPYFALNNPPRIAGARVGYFGARETASATINALNPFDVSVLDVSVFKVNGPDVTATLTYSLQPKEWVKGDEVAGQPREFWTRPRQEVAAFRRVASFRNPGQDLWQIVPPEKAPKSLEAAEFGNVWANLSYYLSQKESPSNEGSPAQRSLSRLKQLGLGTLQFLQDYDERFAFGADYRIAALGPYIPGQNSFFVPEVENEVYSFNGNLSERQTGEVAAKLELAGRNRSQLVMFYEGRNEQLTFRYDGKAAVGFADGSARLVAPDEVNELVWKP